MNAFLLNRQLGQISPQAFSAAQNQRLSGVLQLAADTRFAWRANDGGDAVDGDDARPRGEAYQKAHVSGVNSITIDRFEGR